MGLEVVDQSILVHLANLTVQSELLTRIKAAQFEDLECAKIKQLLMEGKANEFCLKEDGLLTHFKQVCALGIGGLRKEIMSRGGKIGTYTRPVYDLRVPVTRLAYTQTRPV